MTRKVIYSAFGALLFVVFAQGSASADAFADARAAYDRTDFETARALFEPLAKAGNAKAESMLGTIYYFGLGVPQDGAKAEAWYAKAAAQDEPNAELQMYRLATFADITALFDRSKRITNLTVADALPLLRRAAEQGVPYAEEAMADYYLQGRGVPENDAAAFMWLRKAAEHDVFLAQSTLAKAYAEGTGTPVDFVEAYFWLCIHGKKDKRSDQRYCGPGSPFVAKLQPAQIEDVKRRVAPWKPTPPPDFGTDLDAKSPPLIGRGFRWQGPRK